MDQKSYIEPIVQSHFAGTVHATYPRRLYVSQYTDHKVYHRLAAKLPDVQPAFADFVRWSVEGGTAGVAGQRARHFSIYAQDPDIAVISQIPEEAWDPARLDLASKHGIVWLSLADLHHNATGTDPVIAVAAAGQTILFNITLSTTTKHIRRDDGEDENGVTRLLLAVLNHYPTLSASRFAEDVTRAGRDDVDWAAITGKHRTRALTMVFGGQTYDTTKDGDRMALAALGMVSGNDDPMRRRKLTGTRLMKYLRGGAAIAESQMPHGWGHKKDHHGRPVVEGERGLVPEADATLVPVLQALFKAHAAGESYQQLAARMVDFEADGQLRRRDHTDLDNTYAATVGDPQASYGAAKSLFVRSSFRPRAQPTDDAIARYLAGEDPADVFDDDTRLYLAKVELVRTGRYYRRLVNDIRGRNIVLNGVPAKYRDDRDEYGWFDVLSAPWPWPVDAAGREISRFGLDDDTCRQVAARLLRELRQPKAPTGGRAHRQPTRRVLQRFENWLVSPEHHTARYPEEDTQWGVEARVNVSGRANFILLHRPASAGVGARGSRGWSYFGPATSKPDHIAGTGSLAELAASVAVHLDRAVREILDPSAVATLDQVPAADRTADPTASLRRQLGSASAELELASKEAKGHRAMAALAAAEGEEAEAAAYAGQAREASLRATGLETRVSRLEEQLREAQASPRSREDEADVSLAAYLVAGLERAARNNGTGPARLGERCDEILRDWRFTAQEEDLHWACVAHLPLRSGERARLPLRGVIRNVRTRTGKALANTETVARYVFEEGRDLDEVASLLQCTRKTLLTKRVMPHLVQQGVTSRGAKCALVDHPVPDARRLVHSATTGDGVSPAGLHQAYREQLCRTYLDPGLAWGDAAVPDDTTWIQAAVTLLSGDTTTRKRGLPVLEVALAVGRSEDDVRELVKPQKRAGGFTRPRYLAYADPAKTKVKPVGCPHGRCEGRRSADHVVLLPEVAASGFGVICTHCRRAPSMTGQWPVTQFPVEYLTPWTRVGTPGGLRSHGQTIVAGGAAAPAVVV